MYEDGWNAPAIFNMYVENENAPINTVIKQFTDGLLRVFGSSEKVVENIQHYIKSNADETSYKFEELMDFRIEGWGKILEGELITFYGFDSYLKGENRHEVIRAFITATQKETILPPKFTPEEIEEVTTPEVCPTCQRAM